MRQFNKVRGSDAPHMPFYKDERIIGKKVTVSVSLRVLLLSIVLFALAVGYGMFKILDTQVQIHDYIVKGHASRLSDQARTDGEISQLGCYILANSPDNPRIPLVHKARVQYNCPKYGMDPNYVNPVTGKVGPTNNPPKIDPNTGKPIPVPTGSKSAPPTSGPADPGGSSSASPTKTASPPPAPRSPSPSPTPAPTPKPGKSTTPPLINLHDPTCSVSVAGICLVR